MCFATFCLCNQVNTVHILMCTDLRWFMSLGSPSLSQKWRSYVNISAQCTRKMQLPSHCCVSEKLWSVGKAYKCIPGVPYYFRDLRRCLKQCKPYFYNSCQGSVFTPAFLSSLSVTSKLTFFPTVRTLSNKNWIASPNLHQMTWFMRHNSSKIVPDPIM